VNPEPRPTEPGPDAGGSEDGIDAARWAEEFDELLAEESEIDDADRRLADALATGRDSSLAGSDLRRELLGERDPDRAEQSEDLLQRLNTIDFLDGLVGERPVGEVPDRLGDCRIRGLLGRGGMGAVYDAFQETLEREVAVKVLSPTLTADPKMRTRFRKEARASASLHHQHIVPVYGFGEAAGLLYFTMEKVRGVSLDKHLALRGPDGQRIAPRDWARRFAGVADALGHAHRRGILHRDVKPGNVLVHPDGTLALADFGLSKIMTEASVGLSGQGGFFGTLHYASPEQARGADVGPASDLYALGVTMFEVLTGHLPIPGRTPEALLQGILNAEPHRLRRYLPDAPKDLDAVLHRLLQKDASDRYQDGEELGRDLLRVADGEPVRIRRRPFVVRAARWMARHRAVTFATFSFLVLVVVLAAFVSARRDANRQRYELLLNDFIAAVARETGPAAGPRGVLEVLTGLSPEGSATERDRAAVGRLEEAASLLAGDERHVRYAEAYVASGDDPLLRRLRDGDGYGVLEEVDDRIESIGGEGSAAFVRPVEWLELYRLRMLRAVANLTTSVGDPEAAQADLLRAATTRGGAFFPELLRRVVAALASGDSQRLPEDLEPLLRRGPAGCESVAGMLLIAFASPRRPADAHGMSFALSAGERRRLGRVGEELLGRAASDDWLVVEWGGPIERALAADPDPRTIDATLERVHPESPLRSWSVVSSLLADPTGPLPRLPDGRPLPREMLVRGYTDYLRIWDGLGVAGPDLGLFEDRVEPLLIAGDDLATLRLAARWWNRRALRSPSLRARSLAAADAWIAADAEDPLAYFERFRAGVIAQDRTRTAQAYCDLASALQRAVDPRDIRARVADFLGDRRTAVLTLAGAERDRLLALCSRYAGGDS
jgi:hypothetical protein